jgi:hypothetical protein
MWQVIGSPTLAPTSPWYCPKLTPPGSIPASRAGAVYLRSVLRFRCLRVSRQIRPVDDWVIE